MPQGSRKQGGSTEYNESVFPTAARSRREQDERRKVATLRQLAKLPADQLEAALETARTPRQET
jgi:hypothetical protein